MSKVEQAPNNRPNIWGKVKKWLQDAGAWLLSALPIIFFSLALLWVLFAAIIWPRANTYYFREIFSLEEESKLEVWGPRVVPIDAPFVEIHFTLQQESADKQPLLLVVEIPPEFVLPAAENGTLAQRAELHFNAQSSEETQILRLVNARTVAGFSSQTHLNLQVFSPAEENRQISLISNNGEPGQIKIVAEGALRGVLRQYGGGGSEVPLSPLIALFISAATWFYQQSQAKKREENERKEKADSRLKELRQAIQDEQIDQATEILASIQQQGMDNYVNRAQIAIAQKLIDLAGGKISLDVFPEGWLEETASALIYAAQHNLTDRNKWESYLRAFPTDKISDKKREELEQVRDKLGAGLPSLPRDWITRPSPEFSKFRFPPADPIKLNPLAYERTEEDEPYLFRFSNSLFWAEHPLLAKLKSSQGAVLVYGEAGSGKTALARAIGKYGFRGQDVFATYLQGAPTQEEMRRALASRLLDFVSHLPSFLALLSEAPRRLLAETLTTALPASLVLAQLETAEATGQSMVQKKAADEMQKRIWEAELRTHLRLLSEAVRGTVPHSLPEPSWSNAFMTCVRALGFDKHAFLVIDAGSQFNQPWYEETILHQRHRWMEIGLHTLTFSHAKLKRRDTIWNEDVAWFEMHWEKEQMQALLHWRWKQVYQNLPLAYLMNEEAESLLLDLAQGNPRHLVRLWKAIFDSPVTLPLTEDAVLKAGSLEGK